MSSTSLLLAAAFTFAASPLHADDYKKATEGSDVVKNKLFPKKDRVEISVDGGGILNQSFVNSYLAHGQINYFWSETWGFGIDGAYVLNQDKPERACIESFYNDPKFELARECQSVDPSYQFPQGSVANFGPAYVPIREINYMFSGNFIWNPVYGKQLFMLHSTSYFDLFVNMGGGIAMSTYYNKMTILRDNVTVSRGPYVEGAASNPGTMNPALYGVAGRPTPEADTNVMLDFGIGQKYHFAHNFQLKVELRNYTLVGTQDGIDNFFTLWGGLGVRF